VRIRTVKPALFASARVSGYTDSVFRTFVGLFCYADDEGRAEDDVDLIKAGVWPRVKRIGPATIERHLAEIAEPENGPLCRYEVDGLKLLHFINWREHQRVNRPTASKFPPCPIHESDGSNH
jgi:hypothetical protein